MIDFNEDIVLYHGSRGGIEGEIKPISRTRCDFGQGFYLGDSKNQAKGLVLEDPSPYFYKILLKLSNIPNDRILLLSGKDWLNIVLANRKNLKEFNDLQIAKDCLEISNEYDVIIGPIADDRMIEAIRRFEQKALTDDGLVACLQSVDMGMQYVLKTEFACRQVEILEEKQIFGQEKEYIKNFIQKNRDLAYNIIDKMQEKYQRSGLYINEIIKREKEREMLLAKVHNEIADMSQETYDV